MCIKCYSLLSAFRSHIFLKVKLNMIKDCHGNVSMDNTNANIKEKLLVVSGSRLPFPQKLFPYGDITVFLIEVSK